MSKYECPECAKVLCSSTSLRWHMRIHTGEKPYECPHCQKRFNTKKSRDRHLTVHTGERRFVCDQCGKAYGYNDGLRRHLLRHKGMLPHACSRCPKKFVDRNQLIAHSTTHTGEKPFSCTFCNTRFTQASNLSRHLRKGWCNLRLPVTTALVVEPPLSVTSVEGGDEFGCDVREDEMVVLAGKTQEENKEQEDNGRCVEGKFEWVVHHVAV